MTGPHYHPYKEPYVPVALRTHTPSPGDTHADAGVGAPLNGHDIYAMHCLVCHQADGSGVPMMQPPLQDSPSLVHDPEDAIRRVLHGVMEGGKGPKKRSQYANIMPAFGEILGDVQIANVLSYTRQEFAHTEEPITPEQVAQVRVGESK
jgi:mono/diheme cytochrome c family protein